jgi:hypothetical protein
MELFVQSWTSAIVIEVRPHRIKINQGRMSPVPECDSSAANKSYIICKNLLNQDNFHEFAFEASPSPF